MKNLLKLTLKIFEVYGLIVLGGMIYDTSRIKEMEEGDNYHELVDLRKLGKPDQMIKKVIFEEIK